jgi:DNA primase
MEAVSHLGRSFLGLPMFLNATRAEKADTRSELADVMEQAVQHFRLNLNNSSNATDAPTPNAA